jgi:hypothetical protein
MNQSVSSAGGANVSCPEDERKCEQNTHETRTKNIQNTPKLQEMTHHQWSVLRPLRRDMWFSVIESHQDSLALTDSIPALGAQSALNPVPKDERTLREIHGNYAENTRKTRTKTNLINLQPVLSPAL